MNKKLSISLLTLAFALLLASCAGRLKPLATDSVVVTPQPLELRGGKVPADIQLRIPAKWFAKKAELRITPVLKYATGQSMATSYNFQGEKVRGNAITVPYKKPYTTTLRAEFDWKPEMKDAELYLTFSAKVNGKTINLPDLKIGEGVIAIEALADASYIQAAIAPDAFQRIIKEKYDADIHFLIQQANLRGSELKSSEVKEWKGVVQNADQAPNQNVSVEVQAYASPDGGLELNEKLASKREKNTSNYLKRELKRMDVDTDVFAHYTAQDWEGFKELVEKSTLPDKELVLRVLSMYSDPEVREREIKNISVVFDQLAKEILPQLRRSRLIANIEIIGKSDDEIKELATTKPGNLNIEELLYAATLTDNNDTKKSIYNTAAKLFPNDGRALNNLGVLAFNNGNAQLANQYFGQAQSLFNKAGIKSEANLLNLGTIALMNGDLRNAETFIGQTAIDETAILKGLLDLKAGNYANAAKALYNTNTNNGVVAQILNKDYTRALQLLNNIKNGDATTEYLKAIIGVKTNNTNLITEGLRNAIKLDPSLRSSIIKDRSFYRYATLLKSL